MLASSLRDLQIHHLSSASGVIIQHVRFRVASSFTLVREVTLKLIKKTFILNADFWGKFDDDIFIISEIVSFFLSIFSAKIIFSRNFYVKNEKRNILLSKIEDCSKEKEWWNCVKMNFDNFLCFFSNYGRWSIQYGQIFFVFWIVCRRIDCSSSFSSKLMINLNILDRVNN